MRKWFKKIIGDEKGQVALFAALIASMIIGVAAITVDYGFLMWHRRELQNVVDSAALAGAWELPFVADAFKKAEDYINKNMEDEDNPYLEEPFIQPNKNRITVALNNGYQRYFSIIFGKEIDRVPATATAEIKFSQLDVLPIADLELYEGPIPNSEKRSLSNDPFYWFMQGKYEPDEEIRNVKFNPKMDIDEYFKFMSARVYGDNYSGEIDYERNIGTKKDPFWEKVKVKLQVDFVPINKDNPTEEERLGGMIKVSYKGEFEDDDSINPYEPLPIIPDRKIASNWLTLWEQASSGNFTMLNLTPYSSGLNPQGVIENRLNKPLFDTINCSPLPLIKTDPGQISSIKDEFVVRMLEDYDSGYIFVVLPSVSANMSGLSEIKNGEYLMVFVSDFDMNAQGNPKYIKGKMVDIYDITNCEFPGILTEGKVKPEVYLVD